MKDIYSNPLTSRYSSKEMSYIFSDEFKFKTWRKLWITLAKGEKSLGLNITDEQIKELEAFKDDINFDVAIEREKIVKHDVMSHVYAYGVQCPNAKGIIHLGATSCFVGDNTELIVIREALLVIKKKIINVLNLLKSNALKYKNIPTLAYTHFQAAQPTTVGKRLTLYMQDLLIDLEELDFILNNLKLRGAKGTTGSQASFMELFDNDEEKVKKLEDLRKNNCFLFEELISVADFDSLMAEGDSPEYSQNLQLIKKYKEWIGLEQRSEEVSNFSPQDTNRNMAMLEKLIENGFDEQKLQFETLNKDELVDIVQFAKERNSDLEYSDDVSQNVRYQLAKRLYGYEGTNSAEELMAFFSEDR